VTGSFQSSPVFQSLPAMHVAWSYCQATVFVVRQPAGLVLLILGLLTNGEQINWFKKEESADHEKVAAGLGTGLFG